MTKEEAVAKFSKRKGDYYLVEVYITCNGMLIWDGFEPAFGWQIFKGKLNTVRKYNRHCAAAIDAAQPGLICKKSDDIVLKILTTEIPSVTTYEFFDRKNGMYTQYSIAVTKL